jgi:hypothetical protein
MLLYFVSKLSGTKHVQDVDVTEEQLRSYVAGARVQDAFPHLSAKERDYFVLGATPEEWDALYTMELEKEQAIQADEVPTYIKEWFDL